MKARRALALPTARHWVVAVAVAAIMTLTGCSSSSAPDTANEPAAARPVTTEESQLLAIARFNNFDLGTRGFTTEVQERGIELLLQGWANYTDHVGYASVTGDFAAQSLLWTAADIGVMEQEPDSSGNPPLPVPSLTDPAFTTAALTPTASRLDALALTITSLGSDRPDNPLLLQQSGALWLRTDRIGEELVTVFAAPPSDEPRDASLPPLTEDESSLRLWVNEDGVMLRAEARIGTTWSVIDFTDAGDAASDLPSAAP